MIVLIINEAFDLTVNNGYLGSFELWRLNFVHSECALSAA